MKNTTLGRWTFCSVQTVIAAVTYVAGCATAVADATYGPWSAPVNLGTTLNTVVRDGCQFIARDGLTMYMATDVAREDGSRDMDLHVSKRDSVNSPWGAPAHLGYTLNAVGTDDICPALTHNGRILFIASERSDGCGGRDIYVSYRDDITDDFAWSSPMHLGCVGSGGLNTDKTDQGPTYFEDDKGNGNLIFSSDRPSGNPAFGGNNIFTVALGDNGIPDASTVTLVEELSSATEDNRPYMREDGLEVYFDSDRNGPSYRDEIFVATRKSIHQRFSAPQLVAPLSSARDERRAVLGNDGTELYITTNRVGGKGQLDIWMSTRQKLD